MKKGFQGKKIILYVAAGVLFLIVATVVAGWAVFHHYYSKINYVELGNEDIVYEETEWSELTLEEGEEPASEEENEELLLSIEEQLRQTIEDESIPLQFSEDVFNLLIIGCDSRAGGARGRSDTNMLLSINRRTEEIVLTSIMRDSYLYIPGYGNNRINAAHAYGGADLLIETIETNFRIKIDHYVTVDFYAFMDIIDTMGGVEVTVSDAEVRVLNNYVKELNRLQDLPEETDQLSSGGTYLMNGKQALGYSRIRYVGNADYERTERQRYIVEQLIGKSRELTLSETLEVLDVVLPQVTTDVPEGEMLSLVLGCVFDYKDYAIKQCRVPYDGTMQGMNVNGASVLGIDLEANIARMHADIYGESDE